MKLISFLSNKLGLSPSFIYKTIKLAPHSYKKFRIPKKSGGERVVYQPSKKVKTLQVLAVEEFFSKLPVHPCVYSYRGGVSIVDCAEVHKRNNYLLRLDFRDFFGSITGGDIKSLLKVNSALFPFALCEEDIGLLAWLSCFYEGGLAGSRLVIGAPSSPSISNAMLYDFDCKIAQFCISKSITYSRYADDLFFSTNERNVLHFVKREVVSILRDLQYPKLSLNDNKTYHTSKKHRKIVTGLTLTPTNAISIGRDRKREIKSLVFDFANEKLPVDKLQYLRGLLSYVYSVEPSFISSLRKKYGVEIIKRLWH